MTHQGPYMRQKRPKMAFFGYNKGSAVEMAIWPILKKLRKPLLGDITPHISMTPCSDQKNQGCGSNEEMI